MNPRHRSTPARLLLAGLALAAFSADRPARADDPAGPPGREETEQLAVARALAESYPDRPEWVDMLVDILQGSQLGPGDGWFRRAVAQTRFDWKSTRDRLDKDG